MDLDVSVSVRLSVELPPAAYDESVAGDGLDVSNHRAATVVIDVGSYTDGVHTFAVQESDDNDTWTDVPADRISGTVPVMDDDSLEDSRIQLGILSTGRYLRVAVEVDEETDGAEYAAYLILTDHRNTSL